MINDIGGPWAQCINKSIVIVKSRNVILTKVYPGSLTVGNIQVK
jgi:hypothetical protein